MLDVVIHTALSVKHKCSINFSYKIIIIWHVLCARTNNNADSASYDISAKAAIPLWRRLPLVAAFFLNFFFSLEWHVWALWKWNYHKSDWRKTVKTTVWTIWQRRIECLINGFGWSLKFSRFKVHLRLIPFRIQCRRCFYSKFERCSILTVLLCVSRTFTYSLAHSRRRHVAAITDTAQRHSHKRQTHFRNIICAFVVHFNVIVAELWKKRAADANTTTTTTK